MSSAGSQNASATHRGASEQPLSSKASVDEEDEGIIVRPMRLKVLYTFDDQNKTNCLARWPQVMQVRTVAMGEATWIGVIDLKVCIQAIVQCSPELVAKLGQDYTIYAYDYSEYEHPLVGQGMLSWALAASSPVLDASNGQSNQLVTGRVCKNIQGLFSNGVKETLEVKLRLVPVPTLLQSEYLHSMEKYREISKTMPVGFDHNEWLNLLKSNPNIAQTSSRGVTMKQRDGASMEVVNQLLSPSLSNQNLTDPLNENMASDSNTGMTRIPSPAGSRQGSMNPSRPSSRASTKRPRKTRARSTTGGGNTSGYEEGTDGDDGPIAKKRAKTTKTDWNVKSAFGSAPDSLRVAASTAGSLRLFRPIAMAPSSANVGNHLQDLPRAPTPVPDAMAHGAHRSRTASQNLPRRASLISLTAPPLQYKSPYAQNDANNDGQDQIRMSIESAMTSPEKDESSGETPPGIASSPPVLISRTSRHSSPDVPSSPVLPQMPEADLDFMRGSTNELFGDEDEPRAIEEEGPAISMKQSRRRITKPARPEVHHGFAIQEVTPGPPELLPTKMLPRAVPQSRSRAEVDSRENYQVVGGRASPRIDNHQTQPYHYHSDTPQLHAQSMLSGFPFPILPASEHAANIPPVLHDAKVHHSFDMLGPVPETSAQTVVVRPTARMLSRTASIGSLTMPNVTASDPVLPPPDLTRSQTWSDMPRAAYQSDFNTQEAGRGTASRKNAIRQRLENAIANGVMPPFCNNCGAIETPAWRKAWIQELQGEPGYHEYSEAPGRVTAIEVLERDATGKPVLYKVIKKSLADSDDPKAFTEVILCNPCGLWMSKYKSIRPVDKWEKDQSRADKKRRSGPSRGRKAQETGSSFATSEAYFHSDMAQPSEHPTGPLDEQSPPNLDIQESNPDQRQDVIAPTVNTAQVHDSQLSRHSASSVRLSKTSVNFAQGVTGSIRNRAVQSSPVRTSGSRVSPIDIEEDDLGPTRRLLFPSPRKDGSPKVLGEMAVNVVHAMTRRHNRNQSKEVIVQSSAKENRPPVSSYDRGCQLVTKVAGQDVTMPERPTTPVRETTSKNLFKTPTKPTPSHRPFTRSQSKSARSASIAQTLTFQRTPSKTPSTAARRRSPRNHPQAEESPFTANINKLLSEVHQTGTPSRHAGLDFDFSLPDLGHSSENNLSFHLPAFDTHQDFFSTDLPMPSSPPRLFNLYDDSCMQVNLDAAMWSDLGIDIADGSLGQGLVVDAKGRASFHPASLNTVMKPTPDSGAKQSVDDHGEDTSD